MTHRDREEWRHRIGTMLMAAAVVFFLTAWLEPLPDSTPAAVSTAYYGGGLVVLAAGWWLRRRSGPDA